MTAPTIGQQPGPARSRRLFFALWPDRTALRALEALRCQQLPAQAGRTVHSADLHITLLFLGAVPEARLPALCAAAARVRARPLSLRFNALECWQGGRICAAVAVPNAAAEALHRQLRALAEGLGVVLERRPFVPHITLARHLPRSLVAGLRRLSPVPVSAARFCLAESRPARTGSSRYAVLHSWPLR